MGGRAASFLVRSVTVVAAYVALARFGQEFAVTPDGELVVWYPPPGLVLPAVAMLGWTVLPAAVVGELLVALWVFDIQGLTDAELVLNAVLVVGAYGTGAGLLRLRHFDPALGRARDLALFVAAGIVAAVGAGVAGTAVKHLAGIDSGRAFLSDAFDWALGDGIGIATLGPATLLALRSGRAVAAGTEDWSARAILAVAGLLVPVALWLGDEQPERFLYLLLLPIVLAAVRHGIVVAAVAVLLVNVLTTIGADEVGGTTEGRTDLQVLLLVVALTGLALGTLETRRRRASARAAELAVLVEESPDVIGIAEPDGTVRYLNPSGRRMLGAGATTAAGLFADPSAAHAAFELALADGGWTGEARLVAPAGDPRSGGPTVSTVVLPVGPVPSHRRVGFIARDISAHVSAAEDLARATLVDPLTGLANRLRFVERCRAVEGIDSAGVAVAIFDADRFGVLNSVAGHDVGDRVLRTMAQELALAAGEDGPLVARLAGDRFAALLLGVDDEAAAVAAVDRMRAAVSREVLVGDASYPVCVSAGVAVAGEGPGSAEAALRRADLAVARAKSEGGDRTMPFRVEDERRATRWVGLEREVRRAAAASDWTVAFQPIVHLADGQPVGVEALLRMQTGDGQAVSPLEVIRVAEEIGLVGALGRGVLDRSCGALAAWRRIVPELTVSVNVSAVQLGEPDFEDEVEAALALGGLPAGALTLEVTETLLAENRHGAIARLGRLRERGVRISVDDFGTGYSSLARLRNLPVDVLKLDRMFVADLGASPEAAAIVDAIVRLSRARQIRLVAEGVETEAQRSTLLALGCEYAQGWLFSPALPAPDLRRFLLAGLEHPDAEGPAGPPLGGGFEGDAPVGAAVPVAPEPPG